MEDRLEDKARDAVTTAEVHSSSEEDDSRSGTSGGSSSNDPVFEEGLRNRPRDGEPRTEL